MSTQIKGIIWDWGNVLGRFSHERVREQLSKYCSSPPEEMKDVLRGPSQLHESGALSSFRFYVVVRRILNLEADYEMFHSLWSECIIGDNPKIEKILSRLSQSVPIAILSNTDPIHWEEIEKLFVVRQFFPESRRVRSYEPRVRARKPDKKIYQVALQTLGLTQDAAHALFVDDIEENCEAFRALGGHALQYDCSTDPIEKLERALAPFGVFR
ncbi:MAG: HAD-IA family hydrolase [Patescibacteria group bacterium]